MSECLHEIEIILQLKHNQLEPALVTARFLVPEYCFFGSCLFLFSVLHIWLQKEATCRIPVLLIYNFSRPSLLCNQPQTHIFHLSMQHGQLIRLACPMIFRSVVSCPVLSLPFHTLKRFAKPLSRSSSMAQQFMLFYPYFHDVFTTFNYTWATMCLAAFKSASWCSYTKLPLEL